MNRQTLLMKHFCMPVSSNRWTSRQRVSAGSYGIAGRVLLGLVN